MDSIASDTKIVSVYTEDRFLEKLYGHYKDIFIGPETLVKQMSTKYKFFKSLQIQDIPNREIPIIFRKTKNEAHFEDFYKEAVLKGVEPSLMRRKGELYVPVEAALDMGVGNFTKVIIEPAVPDFSPEFQAPWR